MAFMALERAHPVYSFVTPQTGQVAPSRNGVPSFVAEMAAETDVSTSSDVSIPYDAAAELAYSGWIKKYDRPYDAVRYEVFLSNYKAIMVMNVSSKRKARENPDDGKPSLLSLNEYADFTAEEYAAAMNGDSASTDDAPSEQSNSGNILGDAVKAVESQASASSALQDAADALEAEEQVRLLEFVVWKLDRLILSNNCEGLFVIINQSCLMLTIY